MTSLSVALYATTSVLMFMAVAATLLRCITRIIIVKGFGIDDYLMLVALVAYLVYCGCVYLSTFYTKGQHILDISPSIFPSTLMAFYFGELFFVVATCFIKLSIGTSFLRIVRAEGQVRAIYITITVVSVASFAFIFIVIFQCNPVAHFWHQFDMLVPGECFNSTTSVATSSTYGVIIAISDFTLAAIPLFMVWKLQMNVRVKASVVGLLSLGAIAGVAAIVRIMFLKDLATGGDFFYTSGQLTVFTTLELSIGIIVGSAATLRPLFRTLLGEGSSRGISTSDHLGDILSTGQNSNRPWEYYSNATENWVDRKGADTVELSHIKVESSAAAKFGKVSGRSKPRKAIYNNDSEEELTAESDTGVATNGGIMKMIRIEMTEGIADSSKM